MTTTSSSSSISCQTGLEALRQRYEHDLSLLCLPARRWTPVQEADGQEVLDVAIIGAGMAGLALSTALRHLGLQTRNFDQSPAGHEGPWATTARMETLRSPKELAGPALGFAALTFRAWFEAQWGQAAWEALDKIPRLQWMDYLRWYREVSGADVRNLQQVTSVQPRADQLVALQMRDLSGGGSYQVLTRHVVLATGRDGLGGAWVPEWSQQLPRPLWVHSSDTWDGDIMRGKRVLVIGGGASAMDSAATALEAGASSVHLLIRRPELPRVNKGKGSGSPGATHGYQHLPDEWKWRIRHYIQQQQVPPPHGSTLRVSRHENAYFHLDAAIQGVEVHAGEQSLTLQTRQGPIQGDIVIFCTGFRPDWHLRPEFAPFAAHVQLWQDRFPVPAGQEDAELANSPYLGSLFEFQQKEPGHCPGLERVHCFCYPAALSMGTVSGDIPQISDGARRLAQGLAGAPYTEDIALHYERLVQFAEPELDGSEWTPAPLPPYAGAPA